MFYLELHRNLEVVEEHDEDKQVVHRQRLLHDVACEKLEPGFLALDHPRAKAKRTRCQSTRRRACAEGGPGGFHFAAFSQQALPQAVPVVHSTHARNGRERRASRSRNSDSTAIGCKLRVSRIEYRVSLKKGVPSGRQNVSLPRGTFSCTVINTWIHLFICT